MWVKKSHVLLTYKLQVLFLLFRHLCGILWHFCDEDWAPVNRTYGEVQIGCPLGLKCLQFRGEVDLSGLSQCNCKEVAQGEVISGDVEGHRNHQAQGHLGATS